LARGLAFAKIIHLLILISLLLSLQIAYAQTQTEPPILTVYLDGYTQVDQTIKLNQQVLSFNLTIPAKMYQNFLAVDENDLPFEYAIGDNSVLIFNIGSPQVFVSYLTQDYTNKTGNYWTVTFDYPDSKVLILPKNASIITINAIPELIENTDGSFRLTMPPGLTEITYTTEHVLSAQDEDPDQTIGLSQWLILSIVVVSISVSLAVGRLYLHKHQARSKTQPKPDQSQKEVDIDKIFSKNRELRQDEKQVINYLASKDGKAFEAELFELLNLPRTTTWRLIRRLEGLEIVTIKKSRRQNVVLIRDKYLKKQEKNT
jgi:uncharacterized membrane protein